jgi:hypothetical protein
MGGLRRTVLVARNGSKASEATSGSTQSLVCSFLSTASRPLLIATAKSMIRSVRARIRSPLLLPIAFINMYPMPE